MDRIIGIDYGRARVGVAVSDPLCIFASPLETVPSAKIIEYLQKYAESERIVQQALDYLMSSRTTISIAHRLSTVKKADEIIVMNEGRIVERGKHDELIEKNGYYKKLYEMQSL